MTHQYLGAIPRRPDPRDYPMAAVLPTAVALPAKKYWTHLVQLDQGPYGTCVANAWTHFLTDGGITHESNPLLDPEQQPSYSRCGSSAYWVDPVTCEYDGDPHAAELYATRLYDRIHDGILEPLDPGRQNGAYTIDGAKILVRRGLVGAYHRAASVDEVVQCLLGTGPVVFALPWYRSMDQTPRLALNGHRYCYADPASGIRGYHAILLDGVDTAPTDGGPPYVRLRNSWGQWAEKGGVRVPLTDLQTLFINDAWVATELA